MHTRNEVKESRKVSVGRKGTWKHGRIKRRKEGEEGRKEDRKEGKKMEGRK